MQLAVGFEFLWLGGVRSLSTALQNRNSTLKSWVLFGLEVVLEVVRSLSAGLENNPNSSCKKLGCCVWLGVVHFVYGA